MTDTNVAKILAKVADRCAMDPADYRHFLKELSEEGVEAESLNSGVVELAQHYHRSDIDASKEKAKAINTKRGVGGFVKVKDLPKVKDPEECQCDNLPEFDMDGSRFTGVCRACSKRNQEEMERWEEEDMKERAKTKKTPKPAKAEKKERVGVFGYAATAVIRWMGKNKWSTEDAAKALKSFGVSVAEATIKIQLKAGQTGERGDPAPISKSEEKKLKQARVAK